MNQVTLASRAVWTTHVAFTSDPAIITVLKLGVSRLMEGGEGWWAAIASWESQFAEKSTEYVSVKQFKTVGCFNIWKLYLTLVLNGLSDMDKLRNRFLTQKEYADISCVSFYGSDNDLT